MENIEQLTTSSKGHEPFFPSAEYEDEEDEENIQPDNQQQKQTSKKHAEAFLEN